MSQGPAAAPVPGQAHGGGRLYRADAAICNACSRRAQCTGGTHGRTIQHSVYEDYLEKVRGYHATAAYKKAMRKRKVWVEPRFAEAKMWHGLHRLRLRGLLNANIHGLLIAAGQNLKRLLATTGWGRPMPPAAASWPFRWSQGGSRRLWVITDPAEDRGTHELGPEGPVTATPATGGFFQRPGEWATRSADDEASIFRFSMGLGPKSRDSLSASVHPSVSYAFRCRAALKMSTAEVACEMVPSWYTVHCTPRP